MQEAEKQMKTESNMRRLNVARAATTCEHRQVICFTVKPVRSGMKSDEVGAKKRSKKISSLEHEPFLSAMIN